MNIFATLRGKILTTLIVVALVAIGLLVVFIDVYVSKLHQKLAGRELLIVQGMISDDLYNLLEREHEHSIGDYFQRLAAYDPLMTARIMDMEGRVAQSSRPVEIGANIPEWSRVLAEMEGIKSHTYPSTTGEVSTLVAPIMRAPSCGACHGGTSPAMYWLSVDVSTTEANRAGRQSRALFIGSLLIMVAVLIITAMTVHFRMVKYSLRRIHDGIGQLEKGRFGARIELKRSDELGQLAARINRLGDRLNNMRSELQKHHLNELERADRMASVGELAASIAHEIKNPVAGISNVMQVLMSEMGIDEERREIFDEINRQAGRVNSAVNDLLAYARPSPLELNPGSPNEPIQRALTLMEGQAKEAGVAIERNLQPELPAAMLDVQKFQQVMVNLILNAIQAMQGGGKLTVATSIENGSVVVRISDTGTGIPENVLKNIFKPFYTTKHRGTGLGLSISRSIIESHNGSVEVNSEPGKGSTFIIYLPVMKEPSR